MKIFFANWNLQSIHQFILKIGNEQLNLEFKLKKKICSKIWRPIQQFRWMALWLKSMVFGLGTSMSITNLMLERMFWTNMPICHISCSRRDFESNYLPRGHSMLFNSIRSFHIPFLQRKIIIFLWIKEATFYDRINSNRVRSTRVHFVLSTKETDGISWISPVISIICLINLIWHSLTRIIIVTKIIILQMNAQNFYAFHKNEVMFVGCIANRIFFLFTFYYADFEFITIPLDVSKRIDVK